MRMLAVLLCAMCACNVLAQETVELPRGVSAVWDVSKAVRQTTATRDRVCINGLWRWQHAGDELKPPSGNWGYFKVPGSWPGVSSYMQKDSQQVIAHPAWKHRSMRELSSAWYSREIEIPAQWTDKRITLAAHYVNSIALVFVDGNEAGKIIFPAGELDLSKVVQPGKKHTLHLLVKALPLAEVMMAYRDTAVGKQVKGTVAFRGLCGDVWLKATPTAARIDSLRVETSVRKAQITIDTQVSGLEAAKKYALAVKIDGVEKANLRSAAFTIEDLKEGHVRRTMSLKTGAMWDLNNAGNMMSATVSLEEVDGAKSVDSYWPVRFGFREFWIDGRDFYLNGSRIYLSGIYIDNTTMGAAWASCDGVKETLLRLKSFGINYVYTHHYDCQPGSHLALDELLRAADDVGMLVGITQPHFAQYDWKLPDADARNGYAVHAAWYVQVAGSHPSVVFYPTSHNATGYGEDMNPDLLDGVYAATDGWSVNNGKMAQRAQAIIQRLDPSRIVYHHAGGNIGSMITINFYGNFIPVQEMSDWFGAWATKAGKPLFTCEYGVPFTWDWGMYRGWWEGKREFGSAAVPWEFCLSEWNAQFLGDASLRMSDLEKADIAYEAKQFAAGKGWHRWDYPVELSSSRFEERQLIFSRYITDNWRSFRTWGVSGNSPWEFGHFWRLRDGVKQQRKELPTDWENLQRPGFSPDFIDARMLRMDVAFERADWSPTAAGEALIKNNGPVLAYIGGTPQAFTEKDHLFTAGQTVQKQLIVINNSRETLQADCVWGMSASPAMKGAQTFSLPTGEQKRIALQFTLPADLSAGEYVLSSKVIFSNGTVQDDSFAIHVIATPRMELSAIRFALFDPKQETAALLDSLGVQYSTVKSMDAAGGDVLLVGKNALENADVSTLPVNRRVIVFEQSSATLAKLGFRTVEYGLRQVFARVPDHPTLTGLSEEHLRDWRGSATLLPPQLKYRTVPMRGPTVTANGVDVTRVWRCGTRGNVASVLIEKPARGDFLPIAVGGYALQYAPLLEYHSGQGMVIFCQLDVSGRNQTDPAAQAVAANLLRYAAAWKAPVTRRAYFAGNPAARKHLESAGFELTELGTIRPGAADVLILARDARVDVAVAKNAGRLLGLGLSIAESKSLGLDLLKGTSISSPLSPQNMTSPLAGIGTIDLVNRDPREMALIDGAVVGTSGNVVLVQLVPWDFKNDGPGNQRRTYRRAASNLARVLANLGVVNGVKPGAGPLYLDQPVEWDDPYRFFRW